MGGRRGRASGVCLHSCLIGILQELLDQLASGVKIATALGDDAEANSKLIALRKPPPKARGAGATRNQLPGYGKRKGLDRLQLRQLQSLATHGVQKVTVEIGMNIRAFYQTHCRGTQRREREGEVTTQKA